MTIDIDVDQHYPGAERAFEVLRRWDHYPSWWPRRFKARVKDGTLWVRSLPLLWIAMDPVPGAPPNTLVFRYVRGPFRGTGTWHCQKERLGYRVQLKPVFFLLRLVTVTPWFRQRHTRDIEEILTALGARQRGEWVGS